MNEYKALSKETWTNIEVSALDSHGATDKTDTPMQLINDNVFEWSVALIVLNPDSLYSGGYFKAKMTFPKNYPYSPPGTTLTLTYMAPANLGTLQISSSYVHSTTPTCTPTVVSAYPFCILRARTKCRVNWPRNAGRQPSG